MRYVLYLLLIGLTGAAIFFAMNAGPAAPKQREFETSAGTVGVRKIASPLSHPWALAFLPDLTMLVTERGGRLLHVSPDGAIAEIAGVPEVRTGGQGGLLDVVAANDFAETREIFLTFSEPDGEYSHTAVAVARLTPDAARIEDLRVIFRQQPGGNSSIHFGSRVVEALDGTLWVTLGERGSALHAQSPANFLGKVVRINRDGSVPPDNPLLAAAAAPQIWSMGHRNPQGAALDPETGALWTVEHGAKGGDEINKPQGGRNYGWPVITYGVDYNGQKIGQGTHAEGMEQPIHYWDPSIAPSGMMIYSGLLWPDWKGDIFVGALKFQLLSRLDREGDQVTGEERLFEEIYGRVRDVREGPDGGIWFLTDHSDGALFQILPAN